MVVGRIDLCKIDRLQGFFSLEMKDDLDKLDGIR